MSLSSLVKFNHSSLYQVTALFATEPAQVSNAPWTRTGESRVRP